MENPSLATLILQSYIESLYHKQIKIWRLLGHDHKEAHRKLMKKFGANN